MKVPLRLLEFHVADDCNLTCAGCSHFSPFARRADADRAQLTHDVERAGRYLQPAFVHVMGGEPLLNRQLPDLLPLFRRNFPEAAIKVVSNGVLFLTAPDALCDELCRNDIGLAVSLYPQVRVDRAAIETRCADAHVRVEFWPQDSFLDFLDLDGGSDPIAARAHCPMEDACNVRGGRLFPCPVTAWADLGGFEFDPMDGVALEAAPEELADVLSLARVTSLCRYCRSTAERRPHHLGPRPGRDALRSRQPPILPVS